MQHYMQLSLRNKPHHIPTKYPNVFTHTLLESAAICSHRMTQYVFEPLT